MTNNIIDVFFNNTSNKYIVNGGFQWDYGQILRIHNLELPETTEFHVTTEFQDITEICKGINESGTIKLKLPDFIFQQNVTKNYKAYIYVFVVRNKTGATEYSIELNIKTRPKRTGRNNRG